jgi:hypothetical protein
METWEIQIAYAWIGWISKVYYFSCWSRLIFLASPPSPATPPSPGAHKVRHMPSEWVNRAQGWGGRKTHVRLERDLLRRRDQWAPWKNEEAYWICRRPADGSRVSTKGTNSSGLKMTAWIWYASDERCSCGTTQGWRSSMRRAAHQRWCEQSGGARTRGPRDIFHASDGDFSIPRVSACISPTFMPTPDLPKTHLGCAGNVIPSWAELHVGRVSGFNPGYYTSYQTRPNLVPSTINRARRARRATCEFGHWGHLPVTTRDGEWAVRGDERKMGQ